MACWLPCTLQHAVLLHPQGLDKRILTAAQEVTERGLAHVTVLGDQEAVHAEAKKLGLDLTDINIINPQVLIGLHAGQSV